MSRRSKHITIPVSIIVFLFAISACGGFGGRYKIDSKHIGDSPTGERFPVSIRLVLNPELCDHTYTSKRQGAKRVYELGEAFCSSTKDLSTRVFKNVTVVSTEDEGMQGDYDATLIPKVIDTSVLVRPGAPPNFEATIIYECSIVDRDNRTVFLRTIKENKVYQGYGYEGYKIVMQQAVDELFLQLGNELAFSPEIKRFAGSLNTE